MPQSYGPPDAPQAPKQSVAALCSLALAFGLVVLSSVTEMLFAHTMTRVDFEPALLSHQRQVFPDPHAAVIEEHVVVGAQAQDVVRRVRPMVRRPQRPDVGGLRVGPGEAL